MAEYLTEVADLEARYSSVVPTAVTKEVGVLTNAHQRFIERAPFMMMATSGAAGDGLDCSPRGDPPGSFVRIVDPKTILIPDRRGNNRIDSLRNLVADPRIALLFMIPGIGHTMRVNGSARIRVDDEICESFSFQSKTPAVVIEVLVDRAYSQCPKALVRSKLWDPASLATTDEVPSVGQMMEEIDSSFEAKAYDDAYPERLKTSIY